MVEGTPDDSICFSTLQCQRPIWVAASGPPPTEILTIDRAPARRAASIAWPSRSGRPCAEGLRLLEIGGDDLDPRPRQLASSIGVVYERANGQAFRGELPNHLAADCPGRARHENHGLF
jgi:hypothetical protein